jgi:hypothetical protein
MAFESLAIFASATTPPWPEPGFTLPLAARDAGDHLLKETAPSYPKLPGCLFSQCRVKPQRLPNAREISVSRCDLRSL